MSDNGDAGSGRRMDLNLYLGLPHPPSCPQSDLGPALESHSVQLPTEVPHLMEMTTSEDSSSGTDTSTEVLFEAPGNLERDFESEYSWHPFLTSPQVMEGSGQQVHGSCLASSSYSPDAVESSMDASHGPLHHLPCFQSVLPTSPLVQNDPEPVQTRVPDGRPMSLRQESSSSAFMPMSSTASFLQYRDSFLQPEAYSSYIRSDPLFTPAETSHAFAQTPELVHDSNVQRSLFHGISSAPELIHYPEIRLRRLIECNHRWPIRRFRSTIPQTSTAASVTASLVSPSHISHRLMFSDATTATPRTQKVHSLEELAAGDEDEDTMNKGNAAANFECNICLDMAKDPIVTSCGHLFCWPCLYQWLHLHSEHKECPVCKGRVMESKLVPIYGRGISECGSVKNENEGDASALKIPPRPQGCRTESFRQRLHNSNSRGILGTDINSWTHFLDEGVQNGHRVEASEEHHSPGFLAARGGRILNRLRALHHLHRVDALPHRSTIRRSVPRSTREVALSRDHTPHMGAERFQRNDSSPGDAFDVLRLSLYTLHTSDRIAALTAGLSTMMERMVSSGSHSGGSSVNYPQFEFLQTQDLQGTSVTADQASVSSTLAVIQEDAGVASTSIEPSGAGPSRSARRRRRTGPASSDIDGVHPARKRRRLGSTSLASAGTHLCSGGCSFLSTCEHAIHVWGLLHCFTVRIACMHAATILLIDSSNIHIGGAVLYMTCI